MALSLSNDFTQQNGRFWSKTATVDFSGTSDDEGEIVSISDFDLNPFKDQKPNFVRFKLVHFHMSAWFASAKARLNLSFNADTDDFIMSAILHDGQTLTWDLSPTPDGGIVDPKSAGFTGGLILARDVITTADADDTAYFVAYGELLV